MHKTNRRGFTLIELMVVMGIIAVLSVLGVSALIGINNSNIVDRDAEEITTAIRDAQNKAISVASDPGGGTSTPLAWGVYIDTAAKSAQPFYLKSDKTFQNFGAPMDYSILNSIRTTRDTYYFFTTPFGKYYSTTNPFPGPTNLSANDYRPYDIIPKGISANSTVITINFRNNTKSIVVETNGDVHVQ